MLKAIYVEGAVALCRSCSGTAALTVEMCESGGAILDYVAVNPEVVLRVCFIYCFRVSSLAGV